MDGSLDNKSLPNALCVLDSSDNDYISQELLLSIQVHDSLIQLDEMHLDHPLHTQKNVHKMKRSEIIKFPWGNLKLDTFFPRIAHIFIHLPNISI